MNPWFVPIVTNQNRNACFRFSDQPEKIKAMRLPEVVHLPVRLLEVKKRRKQLAFTKKILNHKELR